MAKDPARLRRASREGPDSQPAKPREWRLTYFQRGVSERIDGPALEPGESVRVVEVGPWEQTKRAEAQAQAPKPEAP